MSRPRIVRFPTLKDPSGGLTPFEWTNLPFVPQRVFLLHDVVQGARRGGHAHHELQELIVAVSGSFEVLTRDEKGPHVWTLNRADSGLYVPPLVWRHLQDFSSNAVALVFASTPYDPADYIRELSKFQALLPPVTLNDHNTLFTAASRAYYETLEATGDRKAAEDARTRIFATEDWVKKP